MQEKATEKSFIRREEEEKEADVFAADLALQFILSLDSNSSSLKEMSCREERMWMESKNKRKETARERTREPLKNVARAGSRQHQKETDKVGLRVRHRPRVNIGRQRRNAFQKKSV